MEVYLDPESIQIGSGYYPLPMGNIYFVDDVGAFPDYDYLDFVSIVLVWWTNELMSFAWGAKTVKLRFVDEHYYIHLIHEQEANKEKCKAVLGEMTLGGNQVLRECEFDMNQFAKSLAMAVNTILRAENFIRDFPEEAAQLQLAHGRLRQLVRKK